MPWRRLFILCGLLTFAGTTLAQDNKLLRLACSTSTKNSGLTDYLLSRFIADTGYQVKLFSVGSGPALRLGRVGEVDALLVHAPKAEQRFVAEGYGVERLPVMHNDFIIVGPAHDPAGIGGMLDVSAAFKKLASSGSTFLSRGDDSGTHKKEMSIWQGLSVSTPTARDWYLETGTSMGKALQTASEQQAYTISDRGTWLANKDKLKLSLLVQGRQAVAQPLPCHRHQPGETQRHQSQGGQVIHRLDTLATSAETYRRLPRRRRTPVHTGRAQLMTIRIVATGDNNQHSRTGVSGREHPLPPTTVFCIHPVVAVQHQLIHHLSTPEEFRPDQPSADRVAYRPLHISHSVQLHLQAERTAWKNVLLRGTEAGKYHDYLSTFFAEEREVRKGIKQLLKTFRQDSEIHAVGGSRPVAPCTGAGTASRHQYLQCHRRKPAPGGGQHCRRRWRSTRTC